MARPQKAVDWNRIDDLLKIGANEEEIATVLGLSSDTLSRRCIAEKQMYFADYIKNGLSEFKIGIRRAQLRSALGVPRIVIDENGERQANGWLQAPSVTMQIWLGKQFLGQSDRVEVDNNLNQSITFLVPAETKDTLEKLISETATN